MRKPGIRLALMNYCATNKINVQTFIDVCLYDLHCFCHRHLLRYLRFSELYLIPLTILCLQQSYAHYQVNMASEMR